MVEKVLNDSGIRPPPNRPSSCRMLLRHALRLIEVGDTVPGFDRLFLLSCREAIPAR
jgi:hypothetical protein